MKCPDCKSEMEEGRLYSHGMSWSKKMDGLLDKMRTAGSNVIAWKCPNCKKIELAFKGND